MGLRCPSRTTLPPIRSIHSATMRSGDGCCARATAAGPNRQTMAAAAIHRRPDSNGNAGFTFIMTPFLRPTIVVQAGRSSHARGPCLRHFATIVHRPSSIVHRPSSIVHRPSSIVEPVPSPRVYRDVNVSSTEIDHSMPVDSTRNSYRRGSSPNSTLPAPAPR